MASKNAAIKEKLLYKTFGRYRNLQKEFYVPYILFIILVAGIYDNDN